MKRQLKKINYFDPFLLSLSVPDEIKNSERVTEALLQKKLTPRQKESVKYNNAIKNYRRAVERKVTTPAALQTSLIDTLLRKHYFTLIRIVRKYKDITK